MQESNRLILEKLSEFLNNHSDYIDEKMVNEVKKCGVNNEDAVTLLLINILDLTDDSKIVDCYFKNMIKELDIDKYRDNMYYKNIHLNNIIENEWEVRIMYYKPFELFVYNDLRRLFNGQTIPQIGFFSKEYSYPCILKDNREWMLITPNEIETMQQSINEASGDVLTYGLGLGYFTYMVSLKKNVKSITVIECDEAVVNLFNKYILPQFVNKNKIKIIISDAYEYAKKKAKYDYVLVDIWHDPSDGISAYLQFKELENPDIKYSYWIEDTMKCYIDNLI